MAAEPENLPRHIAVIMDGNGRWAEGRGLPRAAGHHQGVAALRAVVERCAALGIPVLTVFAFSSENWRRPQNEVKLLMELFVHSLHEQVDDLHANNVRVRFIGDRDVFPSNLRMSIRQAEQKTARNSGLTLVVAANYGGRWDMASACARIAEEARAGGIDPDRIDEDLVGGYLNLADIEEPDLFIRTGGERRISNFLLWQLAYTELYFTDVLWPDFSPRELDAAVEWYASRQRRFGATEQQVEQEKSA